MEYKDKLRQLKEIVNKHLQSFTAVDGSIITDEQSFLIPNSTQLLHFNDDDINFDKIFNLKAPNQKIIDKSFFHYKRFDIAYRFIDEDFISASALSNFIGPDDDIKEYEHFFETTKIPYAKSFIEKQKEGLFVFCLTEDSVTERFWNEYVSDHNGLCLEFEFHAHGYLGESLELRKICYDDGNDFKFYADMQDEIFSTFGRYLATTGLAKFGALYKRRASYGWEKETRLLLNWSLFHDDLAKNSFSIDIDVSKTYLKIPLKNNLFTLRIKSIKIGKNLNNSQKDQIKTLADKKGLSWIEE